jgi:hypothetical protein
MPANGTFPAFDGGVTYPSFKLNRACTKCKLGDAEGEAPPKASYNPSYDHILRQCSFCGFLWWERPKGD